MLELDDSENLEDWIISACGAERAFDIFMRFGGQRFYVPTSTERGGRSDFQRFLSPIERQLFVERAGGEYLKMPIARDFCVKFLWWVRAQSHNKIAAALHISEHGVYRTLSKSKRPPAAIAHLAALTKEQRIVARQRANKVKLDVFQLLGLTKEDVRRYGS